MDLFDIPFIVCLLSGPAASIYFVQKETGSYAETAKEVFGNIFYFIPIVMMGGLHVAIPTGAVMVVIGITCTVLGLQLTPETLAIVATLVAFAFWPINFKLMRSK